MSISEETDSQISVLGVWQQENHKDFILFLSSGEVKFEQGELLASINRFQNTQRARYTSRLQRTGQFELSGDSALVLFVTADWTGKGVGARRPQEKQVESRIVFDIAVEEKIVTLHKKTMTRQGDATNLNADEELSFKLIKKD